MKKNQSQHLLPDAARLAAVRHHRKGLNFCLSFFLASSSQLSAMSFLYGPALIKKRVGTDVFTVIMIDGFKKY